MGKKMQRVDEMDMLSSKGNKVTIFHFSLKKLLREVNKQFKDIHRLTVAVQVWSKPQAARSSHVKHILHTHSDICHPSLAQMETVADLKNVFIIHLWF